MTELIDWLRVQLDEDERVAREAAADYAEESGLRWRVDIEGNIRPADPVDNSAVAVGGWGGGVDEATGQHVIRWDPARVLAEVDAKRRIVDDCAVYVLAEDTAVTDGMATRTLHALALPYADRPGYRSEWAP